MFKFSIETMQIWPRNKWRKCCSLKLDRSLDKILSIKNYYWSSTETRHKLYLSRITKLGFPDLITRISLSICVGFFFSQPWTYIRIILRTVTKWCKVLQKNNPYILWPEIEFALVHHILYRNYCIFTLRILWPRSFLIFIVDELKNFLANVFLKLVY